MATVGLSGNRESLLTTANAGYGMTNFYTIQNKVHSLLDRTSGDVGIRNASSVSDSRIEAGRERQRNHVDRECDSTAVTVNIRDTHTHRIGASRQIAADIDFNRALRNGSTMT